MKSILYRIADNEIDSIYEVKSSAYTLVILHESDITDQTSTILEKIFSALKINREEEVEILEVKDEKLNLNRIIYDTNISKVITFGFKPKNLGWHVQGKLYKIHQFEKLRWLPAERLDFIAQDKNHKQYLWTAVQAIYV